jgi:hypothetical protein
VGIVAAGTAVIGIVGAGTVRTVVVGTVGAGTVTPVEVGSVGAGNVGIVVTAVSDSDAANSDSSAVIAAFRFATSLAVIPPFACAVGGVRGASARVLPENHLKLDRHCPRKCSNPTSRVADY